MSRVPFQFLMVPVGTWAPAGERLGLVERAVYAAYHDRHRQGQHPVRFGSGELEDLIGLSFRAICRARQSLVDAGLLVEVSKGGGRGKAASFVIANTVKAPRLSESGNGDESTGFVGEKGGANGDESTGFSAAKHGRNPGQTLPKRPPIKQITRARDGEPAPSPIAAAQQTSENPAAETLNGSHVSAPIGGTPREYAGTPPPVVQKRRSVWAVYLPTGFPCWVAPSKWDADQARPEAERDYAAVPGGPPA